MSCLEDRTLQPSLRGEEIGEGPSCRQERGHVGKPLELRKVKKGGWRFRSAQRNLNFASRETGP